MYYIELADYRGGLSSGDLKFISKIKENPLFKGADWTMVKYVAGFMKRNWPVGYSAHRSLRADVEIKKIETLRSFFFRLKNSNTSKTRGIKTTSGKFFKLTKPSILAIYEYVENYLQDRMINLYIKKSSRRPGKTIIPAKKLKNKNIETIINRIYDSLLSRLSWNIRNLGLRGKTLSPEERDEYKKLARFLGETWPDTHIRKGLRVIPDDIEEEKKRRRSPATLQQYQRDARKRHPIGKSDILRKGDLVEDEEPVMKRRFGVFVPKRKVGTRKIFRTVSTAAVETKLSRLIGDNNE